MARSTLCPRCGSTTVHRSSRRGLERVISALGLFPYRCDGCHRRFYRFGRFGRTKATIARAAAVPKG